MIKILRLAEVKYVAFRIAQKYMGYNEPIPEFSSRYPRILESCLATPFQKFDKRELYRGLENKAAILFYLLIKNHPFQNGNKRIAMTSLLVFLYKNNRWLKVDDQELYNFAVWVASSPPKAKTETVQAIKNFVKSYLVKISRS